MKLSGISRDALRYYVEKGLLEPTVNQGNGYRLYSDEDVKTVRFIRQAKEIGFKISEIHNLLEQMNSSSCSHQSLLPYLREQQEAVREKIETLNHIEEHISRLISDFEDSDCSVSPREIALI